MNNRQLRSNASRIGLATSMVMLALSGCTQDYKLTQSLTSAVAPTGNNPGGSPNPTTPPPGSISQTDTFQVAAPGVVKADILFVIDNSGSMQEEQTAMANAFSSFITEFVNKAVDYHIGIISTDSNSYSNVPITNDPNNPPNPKPSGWFGNPFFGYHNPFPDASSTPGTLLMRNQYPASSRYLSPSSGSTTQIIDMFRNNARLGINGSGTERVIYNALQALDVKKLANENSSFRREDALVAIVGVTDENENISNDAVLENGIFVGSESNPEQRIQRFKNRMASLCGSKCPGWRADLIVDLFEDQPSTPTTYPVPTNPYYYPDFYKKFAASTGSKLYDIYSNNWGQNLANIANGIIKQAESQFKLSQTPIAGSIKVFVNGVAVPENATNGFSYIAASNVVQLNGSALTNAQGKTLRIEYLK